MDKDHARERITGDGFIAALDQSGGSTPKALRLYGIEDSEWGDDKGKMFDLIHAFRDRIITCPALDQRVFGAILFEQTMQRNVAGLPTAQYLALHKDVVPFLKVDQGLTEQIDGVQLMNPIPKLDETLRVAAEQGIFGTKMRSVIHGAHPQGIKTIVAQQFSVAEQIQRAGLMPILEPEVDILAEDKAEAEELLRTEIQKRLEKLDPAQQVMLKLTLPDEPDFYRSLIEHPRVLRVVALSGGYTRDQACEELAQNHGMTASFSRALTEGLNVRQSNEEFTAMLDAAIQKIYDASIT